MRSVLSLVVFTLAASGCELFLDLDDEEEPLPVPPDAGEFDRMTVDTGTPMIGCAADPAYEDLGVPNRRYRTLGGFAWASGRDRCLIDGADIVTINNNRELGAMAALLSQLPTHVNCPRGPCMWSGLSQQAAGSLDPAVGWTWADGTGDNGSLWSPLQPDDGDGVEDGGEDCAMLEDGALFDEPCLTEVFTICECII